MTTVAWLIILAYIAGTVSGLAVGKAVNWWMERDDE